MTNQTQECSDAKKQVIKRYYGARSVSQACDAIIQFVPYDQRTPLLHAAMELARVYKAGYSHKTKVFKDAYDRYLNELTKCGGSMLI